MYLYKGGYCIREYLRYDHWKYTSKSFLEKEGSGYALWLFDASTDPILIDDDDNDDDLNSGYA